MLLVLFRYDKYWPYHYISASSHAFSFAHATQGLTTLTCHPQDTWPHTAALL